MGKRQRKTVKSAAVKRDRPGLEPVTEGELPPARKGRGRPPAQQLPEVADPPAIEVSIALSAVQRPLVGYARRQAVEGGNLQAHVNGRQWSALHAVYAGLGLPRVVANKSLGNKADALRHILDAIADAIEVATTDPPA